MKLYLEKLKNEGKELSRAEQLNLTKKIQKINYDSGSLSEDSELSNGIQITNQTDPSYGNSRITSKANSPRKISKKDSQTQAL